jgi:SAM-dependent methyltransferase
MITDLEKAAAHWSRMRPAGRSRWWTHPLILRHVNRIVCGVEVDGPSAGLARRMRALAPDGGFRRGISVGCGNGFKELELLRQGIVQRFDLFEISATRVEQGRARAAQDGLAERATFHVADAFRAAATGAYDLAYWNNALHHMLDVGEAVRWSRACLVPGGCFVMDDFVGAARFQWPDSQLEAASRVRALLPERFLSHPQNASQRLPRRIERPDVARLIASDPTEAADSEAILPAVHRVFPGAEIVLTGGVVYHCALNDVLANFATPQDNALLQALLLLDETLARGGETHYAVALARAGAA